MLDSSRVFHLQKKKFVLPPRQIHRAGGIVSSRLGECDRLFAHLVVLWSFVEQRRTALLDHLLIAA